MSSPKPNRTSRFFLLIIFFIASLKLCYCTNFCPEIEKQSLLSFKQYLKDPLNMLSSWNINGEVNCCKWKGVVCSNYTGQVNQLHLQYCDLSGKLNPSLLNLKHLRYLDLSQNDFNQIIPSFIGLFPVLEYLLLDNGGFYETIPQTIGNLSNLRTLSLDSLGQDLDVDNLEWLSGLSQLEHLNMNYVNLSKASTNWVCVINKLSSLVELRFHSCNLNIIGLPNDVINISSLAILDISDNEFWSSFEWVFQLNKLTLIDLSSNHFEGPIPSIANTTKLQHIDLSNNYFNSTIPDWLYSCRDLEYVYFGHNSLHGTISNAISNLSSVNTLFLYVNELSGGLPEKLGTISSLHRLSLFENKLTGNLPQSLGKLFNLEYLGISGNMLEGEVNEGHFVNLTKLKYLHAYGNHLTLKVNPNWIPPFKLASLSLGSWNLGTHIPPWLKTQKNMEMLDLSCTGISGQVPSWFWEIRELNLSHNHLQGKIPNIRGSEDSHYSRLIYLSSNQFSGSLPLVANTVGELDLSNNSFSGGISHFLCDMTNETHRLTILHLGGNKLTGQLPDCFMKWPKLTVLNLGNNQMNGSIPNSIGFLANLLSLNLYDNHFSGRLPFSMHDCSNLIKIDLSHNHFIGNMPQWIGSSLTNLRFLILRSNKFSGKISSNICHLRYLQILDLSNNKFSGIIPKCFNNFTAMATKRSFSGYKFYSSDFGVFIESVFVSTKGNEYQYDTILSLVTHINLSKNNFSGDIPEEFTSLVELQSLNLSGNHLKGSIPDRIGDMKQLESLDFSRNFLCGEIPNSLAQISSLSHLNLSYNNLTGRIPESPQLLGFNASSFIGNNLCGPPLGSKCLNDDQVTGAPLNKEDNEGNKSDIDWFYIFLSLGYAVGFSVVCTTLIFKTSWRDAYFELLEDLWKKAYVYSYIKWRRFIEG